MQPLPDLIVAEAYAAAMSFMDYAPVANENPSREFNPLPMANALIAWGRALPIAVGFWERLQSLPLLSEEFRKIAAMNGEVIGRMAPLAAIN